MLNVLCKLLFIIFVRDGICHSNNKFTLIIQQIKCTTRVFSKSGSHMNYCLACTTDIFNSQVMVNNEMLGINFIKIQSHCVVIFLYWKLNIITESPDPPSDPADSPASPLNKNLIIKILLVIASQVTGTHCPGCRQCWQCWQWAGEQWERDPVTGIEHQECFQDFMSLIFAELHPFVVNKLDILLKIDYQKFHMKATICKLKVNMTF